VIPIEAAAVLEDYAGRLDSAAAATWRGQLNPAAEDTASLRDLARRLRDTSQPAAAFHREDIQLLTRLARQLRSLNEPLRMDLALSATSRQDVALALALAGRLEVLSQWIEAGMEGKMERGTGPTPEPGSTR
jgi:hypothetical protein